MQEISSTSLEATKENALIAYTTSFQLPEQGKKSDQVHALSERAQSIYFLMRNLTPFQAAISPDSPENRSTSLVVQRHPKFNIEDKKVCYLNESSLAPSTNNDTWWDVVTYVAMGTIGLLGYYLLRRKKDNVPLPDRRAEIIPVGEEPPSLREQELVGSEPIVVISSREELQESGDEVIVSCAPSFERLGLSIQALKRAGRGTGRLSNHYSSRTKMSSPSNF